MFAIGRPYILVDILRLENRVVAKLDGYRFREFVVAIPAFLFRQAQEIGRTVKLVLAAQREVRVVELHAIVKERMHLVLHLTLSASAASPQL